MPKPYVVVLEFLEKAGGSRFLRTRHLYLNEAQFKRLHVPSEIQVVIAKEISLKMADVLLAEAPVICIFLSAVEEAFQFQGNNNSPNLSLQPKLNNAIYYAQGLYSYRIFTGVKFKKPEKFEEHLQKICSDASLKAKYMSAVVSAYFPATDRVNLGILYSNLKKLQGESA